MSAFPKYPAYKDSGVEWLGEVPEHWDVLPGRTCLSLNKEKNGGNIETTVLSLSYGRVVIKPPEKLTGLVPASFEGYQLIRPGDVIIRPTDLQNDTTSLRVGLAKDRGIITSAYLGLRPVQKASSEFLYYLLHAYDLMKVYYGMGTGMRQSLEWRDFKYLNLSLPPRAEQDRIVAFLDEKTAQIDALIAKKQRQIELLDEQKAILINRAVTRGLHPNPDLQDSGIPWVGPIPKGWSVPSLKHLAKLSSGGTPDRSNSQFWMGGTIPWLKTGEIENNVVTESEERITAKALRHSAVKISPKGTLLLAMYGQGVTRGRVALLGIDAAYNQACLAIETGKPALQEYLFWFFQAGYRYLRDNGNETSQMNLNSEVVGGMKVLLPHANELQAVAASCETIRHQMAAIVDNVESQIQTLQTLRSTLIAHAVTGKIKVDRSDFPCLET